MVNFRTYGVTTWLTNNCNTDIANILRRKGNQSRKFGQLTEYNKRKIFLHKSCRKRSRGNNFVNDLSRKVFLVLYSSNWPDFIVWLPLPLEILGNICTEIICLENCDVKIFQINFFFQTMKINNPFVFMTKKSRKKFKYLEYEKSF